MKLSDFDYILPEEKIALQPVEPKDMAKMLVLDGSMKDDIVGNLANYLDKGDLLIFNDSKVIPAKLVVQRVGHNGVININLHKRISPGVWSAFARPGKKIRVGEELVASATLAEIPGQARDDVLGAPDDGMRAPDDVHNSRPDESQGLRSIKTLEKQASGQIILDFNMSDAEFYPFIEKYGSTPLPPYIEKHHHANALDKTLYQTIYAKDPGSVAAPTAGLHFTAEMFAKLKAKGVNHAFVTLHVGGGTFLPVKTENLSEHVMHSETCMISKETADLINATKARGNRVITIGTTSTRTLEYAANEQGIIEPYCGEVDLFITPGYKFKLVDMMLTNFHLPKSTLLMLVSAFAGYEEIKEVYQHAISSGYRFYSYGDCCLLYRKSND